jgi:hypothetical protein
MLHLRKPAFVPQNPLMRDCLVLRLVINNRVEHYCYTFMYNTIIILAWYIYVERGTS